MKKSKQEEKYVITPWGCLSTTLKDYNVDISHITPAMGKHMVEDFMDAMVKAGHVEKVVESKVVSGELRTKQDVEDAIDHVLEIIDEISDDQAIQFGCMAYGDGKEEVRNRVLALKGDEKE